MSVNRNTLRQQARFGEISPEEYAAEIAARDADWRKLSPQQQLDALDRRLGKGVGANRQRAKLTARLTTAPVTATVSDTKPAEKRRNKKKG